MQSRPTTPWLTRLQEATFAPRDVASLSAMRILLGLVMFGGTIRFLVNGWVDRFFVQPDYFFTFWGFGWVEPLGSGGMHAVFVAMAVAALFVAAGFLYRPAIVVFWLLFTYVELIDVSNYLNHYYLVSLLTFLMIFLPLSRAWSVDAWLRPRRAVSSYPAWMVWLMRAQVGLVYFYAGVAKIGSDWLLDAQPLNIWMSARTDTPLIGSMLDLWWVALAMSWAGLLNDLLMPFLLSHRWTRPWAYAAVVVFHGATGWLFNIGLFPVIMVTSALIFFPADWPRRLLRLSPAPAARPTLATASARARRWILAAVTVWCAVQVLMPLRGFLYGGDIRWHEQGMRWSWRVMLREKNGSVVYTVTNPRTGKARLVYPSTLLTDHQEREMSGQPDLILRLGHDIGREWAAREGGPVEVRADAFASLNGRPPARLIDPEVDLMAIDDGVAPAGWILPAPDGPPIRLRPATSLQASDSRQRAPASVPVR